MGSAPINRRAGWWSPMIGRAFLAAMALTASLSAPARAQDAAGPTAEQAIERGKEVFGPPPPKPRCGSGGPGEIVICAPGNGDEFRVQSTAELDPDSLEAKRLLDGGIPRAPQVGTVIDCSRGGCIGFGSVPPPAYIIDFSTIPEPPPGSDADLISKGEKKAP
jgi:hypothetical protein